MALSRKVGTLQKIMKNEETQIEWEIENFFHVFSSDDTHHSPSFFIGEAECCLRLWPQTFFNLDSMGLFMESKILRDCSIDYNFGLKKPNGCVELMMSGTWKKNQFGCGSCSFVKRSEILQRKMEIAPLDVLTIKCLLRAEIVHSTQPAVEETKTLKLISLDRLSEKLKGLFANKETCDTILKMRGKEYKAHRAVLIAQSPVFAAMFTHDTSERQTGVINVPDCDPDSFQEFLEYLYCGKLEEISYHSALDLYVTSDKYEVPELKAFCVKCLMQCLTVENICEIVVAADRYDEIELLSAGQDFFNENVCEIFETSEWESLMKSDTPLANKLLKEMSKVKLSH